MKIYRGHSPQNLALTKILQRFRKNEHTSGAAPANLFCSSIYRDRDYRFHRPRNNRPSNNRPPFNRPPPFNGGSDNAPPPTGGDRPVVDDADQTPMQRLLDRYMNRGSRDGRPEPMDGLRGIRGDDDLMRVRVN